MPPGCAEGLLPFRQVVIFIYTARLCLAVSEAQPRCMVWREGRKAAGFPHNEAAAARAGYVELWIQAKPLSVLLRHCVLYTSNPIPNATFTKLKRLPDFRKEKK